MTASPLLDSRPIPLIGAPMAGGPTTAALAAAVSDTGALGCVVGGYLDDAGVRERVTAARALTDQPVALNVFMPEEHRADAQDVARYARALDPWAARVGVPPPVPPADDPSHEQAVCDGIIAAAIELAVPLLTCTFGLPTPERAQSVHEAGLELGITVASMADARRALDCRPEVLIVQGPEAGGHRSSLDQRDPGDPRPLPELLTEVRALVGTAETAPALVAAGGVMTRAEVLHLLATGADAVQVGTALLLAEEAGTSRAHRRALAEAVADPGGTDHATVITRVFSGRAARGLANEATASLGPAEIVGYPAVHHMTGPLRAAAGSDPRWTSLWAGTGHRRVTPGSAAEIIARLAP